MATYMKVRGHFQKVSEIEIFRKSRVWVLIWSTIILMCPKWYKCCQRQQNVTVAHFQQNCCFSATNVDFSCKYYFIRAKIEKLTKKQHLLLKNNTFVENQQQWCYVALHIIYSIRTLRNPSICFAQFFDSSFWWISGGFTKEKEKWISLVNPTEIY